MALSSGIHAQNSLLSCGIEDVLCDPHRAAGEACAFGIMQNAEPPPQSLGSGARGEAAAMSEGSRVMLGRCQRGEAYCQQPVPLASHKSECETVKTCVLVSAPDPWQRDLKPLESPKGPEH